MGEVEEGGGDRRDPRVEIERLLDERAIERVVLTYCRGIDRLDRELVRSCYHADATDEHGSFTGGRDEFVEWVFGLLEKYSMTMHLVGNVLVDVAGTVARCETYGVAVHRGPSDEPFDARLNLTTGFRYLDRFERRGGRWAIARRVATTEWSRVDDAEHEWEVPPSLRRGARDETDPLHWLVPEVDGR
jgi:hypothetical protein